MRKMYQYVLLSLPLAGLLSCSDTDPNSPGIEFMPDMYRSTSYESNSENVMFADSMSNRLPVSGTIARGYMPYPYSNDSLGYELAGRNLRNPVEPSATNIANGKMLYTKFCVQCHGDAGDGQGQMIKIGVYPAPPPSYVTGVLKTLPEGKMMHTLQHGKGMMGSHASQLNMEERWKIIRYIQSLQGVDFAKMSADSVFMSRSGNKPATGNNEEKKPK